jgi:hypothetical protein
LYDCPSCYAWGSDWHIARFIVLIYFLFDRIVLPRAMANKVHCALFQEIVGCRSKETR